MAERLKTLIESRAKAWDKMNGLRDAIGGKPPTAEQRSEWDNLESELTSLSASIAAEGRMTAMGLELAQPMDRRISPLLGSGNDGEEVRVAQAFGHYLRDGFNGMSPEDRAIMEARVERRAQAAGTPSAGGYLVPSGYWEKITETLKAYGGLMAEANIIRTDTGNPLPWPSNNDTGNLGALLSENTQISEVDLTFGTNLLNAWTYTSNLLLVSLQLLQDSAFDLDTWLPTKIGQRLGRGMAPDFITGNGTAKPLGIVTGVTTGVTGAAGTATSITYPNIVTLVHSIDPAYRQMGNCRFLLNDLTVTALRLIVDGEGRPLWSPSMVQGLTGPEPDTLLGYPLIIDNGMPVMAANAKSILFGDFRQGYVIRQVLDPTIMRLQERYADYLQVGYVGFVRVDGRPDDAAAVRAYVNGAS